MTAPFTTPHRVRELATDVAEISEQNPYACYQCGKCSAVCPFAAEMDLPPHQMLRAVQMGQMDRVMDSNAPWLCVGCMTCAEYCPKGVDPARLMEAVRTIHMRRRDGHNGFDPNDGSRLSGLPQSAVVAAMRKVAW